MNPDTVPARPRVLLVEDDPVSAAFLRDAITAFPAEVDLAGSLAAARRQLDARRPDLLLVDAHLPDGTGADFLAALRRDGVDLPALAHTAGLDAALRESLLQRGFVEVLTKPLAVGALHAALARHLPPVAQPDWNDRAALAALGDPAHVQALRTLFLAELPGQRERVATAHATGNEQALRAELHRLEASCGFVGASRLAAAVRVLHAAPADPHALRDFDDAVRVLLDPVAR